MTSGRFPEWWWEEWWREEECELGRLGLVKTEAQAVVMVQAAVCWLSDLCSYGGMVLGCDQVPGWGFLKPILTAARAAVAARPLGGWFGRAHATGGARPGCWVVMGEMLGWLRCWRREISGWKGGVVWAPGAWGADIGGWRKWVGGLALQGRWPCGTWVDSWEPEGSLRRRWGLRAHPGTQSRRLEVWV